MRSLSVIDPPADAPASDERYQPLLTCAGKCKTGKRGLGTRHRFVRKESFGNTMDVVMAHEVWKCVECGEERRWG